MKIMTWETFYDISNSLDEEGFTLFFKKDGEYFAAPEDSRIVFAKIKSNDTDDLTTDPGKEIKFMAKNLSKSKKDDPKIVLFGEKDIPSIKVCDKRDVVSHISKKK